MHRMIALAAAASLAVPAAAAQLDAPADAPVTLDRTFMVGYWTDTDNCSQVIEFDEDGRFVAADGREGLWALQGDALTVTSRATLTVRIVPVDEDTIMVVKADGSLGRSTRCAGHDDELFTSSPIA
jgi:hypothetical protein